MKKFYGVHGKIHIDLQACDRSAVHKPPDLTVKLSRVFFTEEHLRRRVYRLVKKILIQRHIGDLPVSVQDILDPFLYQRRRSGGRVLFLSDRIGDHHIIEPAVKKDSDHNYRDTYRKDQHNSKF